MANYRAYVYCEECDRPLRKNEYRIEGYGRSYAYYCRTCNQTSRKPFNLAGGVLVVLLIFLMTSMAAGMLTAPIYTYSEVGVKLLAAFAFIGLPVWFFAEGWRERSKCKPIYDRWVTEHGLDPKGWPDAPKLYRATKTLKWANMSKRQRIVFLIVMAGSILLVALILYDNYKAGLF